MESLTRLFSVKCQSATILQLDYECYAYVIRAYKLWSNGISSWRFVHICGGHQKRWRNGRSALRLLERRSYLYPWGAAHAQNGLASARTVSGARHPHQWGAAQPMPFANFLPKLICQNNVTIW